MRRRAFLAGLLAAAALAATPASARMHAPYRGHRILPALTGPPLDGLPVATGAYSFRKLRTAYAGSAVKLQRVDLATQDIGFLGCTGFTGCPFDVAAAMAFCTSACTVQTIYNQGTGGATYDLVQATAANQPVLVLNCLGANPCMSLTGSQQLNATTNVTPATGTVSFSAVGNRTLGNGACALVRENANAGNRFTSGGGLPNQWRMFGGTAGSIISGAVDNAWHAGVGVVFGAGSVFEVDGVAAAPSTVDGSVTAGLPGIVGGGAGTTCLVAEAAFWDNVVLNGAERAALTVNQRSFWGF